MSTLTEIQIRAGAERYAAAIAAAAAAEERIKALTDALAEAEYLRSTAEQQLSAIQWPDEMPTVWHMGTGEPPAEVQALIDLYSGQGWARVGYGSTLWRRIGTEHTTMRYEWPIEDAGPFIALPDSYGLATLGDTLDRVVEDHAQVRAAIYGKPGYREDGESAWNRPGLAIAVDRVLTAMERAKAEAVSEASDLRFQVKRLQQLVDALTETEPASEPESAPEAQGATETVDLVAALRGSVEAAKQRRAEAGR
ncbi:MAG: hypothetical protein AAGC63_15500 [Propionicimonas sp.]|nr:hypothetical protein [Propionicimonas sp.]